MNISKARRKLALRRSKASVKANAAAQDHEPIGFYRLADGQVVAFNGVDLENNESLRNAFIQAVLAAEYESRNATWN